MHFALPPRKSSRPPYAAARQTTSPWLRRARLRLLAWIGAAAVAFVLLISLFRDGQRADTAPPGTPRVVIVTSFAETYSERYGNMIRENRKLYADLHGYATFFPTKSDYDVGPQTPESWAKIPAVRHAMTIYNHSTYFFYLDQHALIMRPDLSIDEHIMKPSRLKEIAIYDHPVVPPDSVIHTYTKQKPEDVDAVFSQDSEGLGQGSFILRRGEWAKFFLDAWFDPLYRSYNFQRAEGHALEHLVQWHGTVLLKFALVPQKLINAYTKGKGTELYSQGDFVANFHGCDVVGSGRNCEDEVLPLYEHLQSLKLSRT